MISNTTLMIIFRLYIDNNYICNIHNYSLWFVLPIQFFTINGTSNADASNAVATGNSIKMYYHCQ